MKCPACSAEVEDALNSCPKCNSTLVGFLRESTKKQSDNDMAGSDAHQKCQSCHSIVLSGAKFCSKCGLPVRKMIQGNSQIKCPVCFTWLDGGISNCTKCGTTVNSIVMSRCADCGIKLSAGDKFCPRCGLDIADSRMPPPKARHVSPITVVDNSEAKKTNWYLILIIMCITLPTVASSCAEGCAAAHLIFK